VGLYPVLVSDVGTGTTGVAGRTYPSVEFRIEADRAASFARSIGADPSAGVPPTFAAVYSLGVTAPQLFGDPEAAVDFSHLLHAEQEFTWSRHPRAGETVSSQGRVVSDVSRRGMRFVTFETETTDGSGQPLCRSKALFVIRS
jgi:N-terminal half of MaoC dehydratase